jgi:hypothetical protein
MKKQETIKVNIYADEVQEIEDPSTSEKWIYIGLIVENLDKPLLDEIIAIRYMNNFDVTSPYFKKNDRIIHLDLFLLLFERMINEPGNPYGIYQHKGRIMIRFFPREKTEPDDIGRYSNQFYTERRIYYIEQKSG